MKGVAHKRIGVVLILAILACGSQSLAMMKGLKDPLLKSRGGGADIEMAVLGGDLPAHGAGPAPVRTQEIVDAINASGEGSAEYDPEDQSITVQPKPGFCARHCTCLTPFFNAIRQRWAMLPAGVKEGILVGLPVVGNAMINFATGNSGKAEGAPLAFGLGFGPFIAEVCQPYSIWIKIPVGAVAGILDYTLNSLGLYGTELPYGLCYLLAAVFVGWTAANIVKDPEGIDAQQLRAYGRLPLSVQRETAHKFVADAKTVCDEYRYKNFGSESV